jgi:hypothetical protein
MDLASLLNGRGQSGEKPQNQNHNFDIVGSGWLNTNKNGKPVIRIKLNDGESYWVHMRPEENVKTEKDPVFYVTKIRQQRPDEMVDSIVARLAAILGATAPDDRGYIDDEDGVDIPF